MDATLSKARNKGDQGQCREWQLFLKCGLVSAAGGGRLQNVMSFVNDLSFSGLHNVSPTGHRQDRKSRLGGQRRLLRCRCFEAEAAQGQT